MSSTKMNTYNSSSSDNIEHLRSYSDTSDINKSPIQFKSEAANIYYNAMRVKSATPSNLQQQQQQPKKKKQEKKKIRWNKKTKKGKFNNILPTSTTNTIPPTTTKVKDTPRTTSYYESKMAQLLKKHRTVAAEHTKEMNKSPSDLANDMTIKEKVSSSKVVVNGEDTTKKGSKKKKSSTNTNKHTTLDEFYDDEPVEESTTEAKNESVKKSKQIVKSPSLPPDKKSGIVSPAIVDESTFLLDMLEEEKEKKVVSSEKFDVENEESNFIADMIEEEKNKVVSSEKLNDFQEGEAEEEDVCTDISDDKKPVVNIIAGDESHCSSISESTSPSGKVVKRFDVDKSIEKFEAVKRRKHNSSTTTTSKKTKIKEQALEKMKKAIRFSKSNSTSSPQDDTAISSTENKAFSPNLTGEFTNREESGVPSPSLKGYEHRLAQALATSNRPETAVAFLKEEDIPLSPQFMEWIEKKESSLWKMDKEEMFQYWLDVLDTLLSHQDMTEIIVDTVGEVFVSVNDYFSIKEEDKGAVDEEVTPPMPATEDDEKLPEPIKKRRSQPKSVLKSGNKRNFKPKETIDAWHKIDAFLNRTSNMQTDDTAAGDLKAELLRLAKLEEDDDNSIKTELFRLAQLKEEDDSSIKTEQCTTKSEDSIVTECPDKEDEASIVTESPDKDGGSIVTETPSGAVNNEMVEKLEKAEEPVVEEEELPREDWRKLLKALLEEVEKEEFEDKHTEELHEFISNEQDVLDSYERKASVSAEAKHDTVDTSTALVTTSNTIDTTAADNTKPSKQKKKQTKKKSAKKKSKAKELKVWEKTEDDKSKKDIHKKDKANQLMAQELKVWEKDASDNSTAASSNLLIKGDASLRTAATGSTVDTHFSATSCNGLRVEILELIRELTVAVGVVLV